MDELRRKYKRGEIDEKTYQEKLTELTIFHLKAINYKYVGKIAEGAHGVVIEMKSPETVLNVAVKIIFDDFELGSSLMSWPKLIHENVLPLLTWRVIWQTNSKAYITLKYNKTLQNKISSFRCDFSGFEKAVNCTRDIMNAINYLHNQGLCHLNLRPDRIFVDYNNKVRLGGFSYLTSKDTKNLKYGTAAVFRPPEVYPGTNRKVDGQKFDIWSLGVLAVETFTGEYLSKEMSKWQAQPETWYMQLYGLLHEVLEKEMFKELVRKHIPNWKVDKEKLDQLLSFIKSCLIFNLEDRPSVDDLLNLRLFGGNVEKYCPKEPPDIWAEMVCSMDLVMNASEKRNLNLSDSDFDISDNENIYNEKPLDEVLEIKDATVKNDKDFSVENNSVNELASDCEKDVNSKVEEKEKYFVSDAISNESDIKDDKYENNNFDKIIETKFVENDTEKIEIKENNNDDMNVSKSDQVDKKDKDLNEKERSNVRRMQVQKVGYKGYIIRKNNALKLDRDIRKDKSVFHKENKKINVEDKSNALKMLMEELDMKMKSVDSINVSGIDKEITNDVKKIEEKVELKENLNDVINKSTRDKDMNDMENKIDKNNVNIANNDGGAKEEKNKETDVSDISNLMNDRIEKEEKMKENDLSDKNNLLNDDDLKDEKIKENDISDISYSMDDQPVSFEMHDTSVFISNSDLPGSMSNNIELSSRKKKLKRRRKKDKSELILNTSSENTDAKPERRSLECRKTKKRQYNQNLFNENKTIPTSNENSMKYNFEKVHQSSRPSLSKDPPQYKYLEMQEYQQSYRSLTQKESVEEFYSHFKMHQDCSLNIYKKRDDTNRKERSERKTYAPKSGIEMVKKSPLTSSSEDHKSVRKIYSPKTATHRIKKSPATSSSENQRSLRKIYSPKNMTTFQDDEYDDLEPGEIPLFKKDYDKILDEQGPEYSVASLSCTFTNDDEEDLEEGEIDPNNPDSNYDSKPTRIHRRFKHLRSWWKRQKKNITSCFNACFCTSGLN